MRRTTMAVARYLQRLGQARRDYARAIMPPEPDWILATLQRLDEICPGLPRDALLDLFDMSISYQRDPERYA